MTTIAWDGRILAADRLCSIGGTRVLINKIKALPSGDVVAWSGRHENGLLLAKWYEDGADPKKFPKCQESEEGWTHLVVLRKDGVCGHYDRQPIFQEPAGNQYAWGTGMDFALVAMHLGKNAIDAIDVTSVFDINTGLGVVAYRAGGELVFQRQEAVSASAGAPSMCYSEMEIEIEGIRRIK